MNVSNFSLDWLSFTYSDKRSGDLIGDFWKIFPELASFRQQMFIVRGRHYQHGLCFNKILTIRYDDDDKGRGVNVEIPSHGLKEVFDIFGVSTVRDMFLLLNDRGCVPSRIDLAFDDFNKTYRPVYYYKKYLSGAMVTRMRCCQMCHSGQDKDATTFYLGDRRKKMLRIYDKFKESDGAIDSVRYEIELHSTACLSFFKHIVDSSEYETVAFGDLLLSIFRICHKGSQDHDKQRWQLNEKWFSFIKSTFSQRFIKIPTVKKVSHISDAERFVMSNKRSLQKVFLYHGVTDTIDAIFAYGLVDDVVDVLQYTAESEGLPPDFYINRASKFYS